MPPSSIDSTCSTTTIAVVDDSDLVLLDVEMPEMDGFEVCARLKQLPKLTDVPVIFISSYAATEDKVKAFECGGVDYITKPIAMAEVIARIQNHLNLRQYQA